MNSKAVYTRKAINIEDEVKEVQFNCCKNE